MEAEPKLQPYLLLAKGARGRGLADLIVKATSEPGLFAFAELLDLPQVQEVSRSRAWPSRFAGGVPLRAGTRKTSKQKAPTPVTTDALLPSPCSRLLVPNAADASLANKKQAQ